LIRAQICNYLQNGTSSLEHNIGTAVVACGHALAMDSLAERISCLPMAVYDKYCLMTLLLREYLDIY
jgi:hypothetical protein